MKPPIYNPAVATTAAQYEADLRTICTAIRFANADNRIMLWVPPLANESTWPESGGDTWGAYALAVRRVAASFGAGIIDLGSIDLVGRGLTSDGLHPNDQGHYLIYQRAMQSIIAALGTQDRQTRRTSYTPVLTRMGGGITVGYGAGTQGWFVINNGICTFSASVALSSMTTDSTGYLAISLPVAAASSFSDSLCVGNHVLAVGAGNQLLCETLPGGSKGVLRGFAPAGGAIRDRGAHGWGHRSCFRVLPHRVTPGVD